MLISLELFSRHVYFSFYFRRRVALLSPFLHIFAILHLLFFHVIFSPCCRLMLTAFLRRHAFYHCCFKSLRLR